MGDFLTKPITDKISEDGSNTLFTYGASSMQGWRVAQEDAHNCILDFDDNVSFFAVYDGHGGSEVSTYSAAHFPLFLKNLDNFKSKNFEAALIEGFLKFDESLISPETQELLKKNLKKAELNEPCSAANEIPSEVSGSSKGYISENFDNPDILRIEASKPIEEILASYYQPMGTTQSPYFRAKRDTVFSLSSSEASSSKSCLRNCNMVDDAESSYESNMSSNGFELEATDCSLNKNCESNGSKRCALSPAGSAGDAPEKKKKRLKVDDLNDSSTVKEFIMKSEIDEEDDDDSEDETFEIDVEMLNNVKGTLAKQLLKRFKPQSDEEDEDDDEYDEENANDSSSDDEDDDVPEEGSDEEDNDNDRPAYNSGCTSCVALISGDDLFVANAGDSRCIVSKNGKAIDMSIDHKPEDEEEITRIEKAGGKVTGGRINGDLNLSRAFGDHSYKADMNLSSREQLLIALPDIRKIKIEPDIEFIVVACDGIWNCMTSQEVVNFINERLSNNNKLSTICEQMFDKCLSPISSPPDCGCDNMTCIIVKPNCTTNIKNVDSLSTTASTANLVEQNEIAIHSTEVLNAAKE